MLTHCKIWLLALCLLAGCYSPPAKVPFPHHPDFFEAIEKAKNQQRPILILFDWKGSSVDALAMLAQPEVARVIAEKFVFVHVFADDSSPWPDGKPRIDRNGYAIKSKGSFFQDMQYRFFKDAFQPMYALLSPDGKPLASPTGKAFFEGYLSADDPKKVQFFCEFLKLGLSAREK